jgi:hypothetical protein
MAATFVSTSNTNFSSVTTNPKTFSVTLGAGELGVLAISFPNTTTSVSTVATGVAGLTYTFQTAVQNTTSPTARLEIWRCLNTTGTTSTFTLTITQNTTGKAAAVHSRYSGTDTTGTNGAGAFGATQTRNASGTSVSTTLTTTRDGSWVSSYFGATNTTTVTAGASQTQSSNATTGGAATTNTRAGHVRNNAGTTTSGTAAAISWTYSATTLYTAYDIEIKGPAPVKATLTTTHTTDTLKRAAVTPTHTTSSVLRAVQTRSHTTDAYRKSNASRAPINVFEEFKEFLGAQGNTSSTTYIEPATSNAHGLFDPSQFDNISGLYLEFVGNVSASVPAGSVKLVNLTDGVDFSPVIGTASITPVRVRSSSIPVPSSPKLLAVQYKSSSVSAGFSIQAVRLVIQQGSNATKKETEVAIGGTGTQSGSTLAEFGIARRWLYEATQFDGITGIYFDAELRNTTTGTTTLTLRDLTSSSDIATLTHVGTTETRYRSADIKAVLTDGHEYSVYVSATSGSSASIGIARVIIAQANFTKTQLILTPQDAQVLSAATSIGPILYNQPAYPGYNFTMYAEMVAINSSTSTSVTGALTNGTTGDTNGSITSDVGSTAIARKRNLSALTTPNATRSYYFDASGTFGISGSILTMRVIANIATTGTFHSTDAQLLLRNTGTVTHTADSYLKPFFTKPHTTNANLKGPHTVTQTTDAVKRVTQTLSHPTDSNLKGTLLRTQTTDSLLRAAVTKTHTVDAVKRTVVTKTQTTDALKRAAVSPTHTTSSLIRAARTLTQTTDARLTKTFTTTHTTDGDLRGFSSPELVFTSDALLRATLTLSHAINAGLKTQVAIGIGSDALLRAGVPVTHTASSFIRREVAPTHTTDARLRQVVTAAHTTDALVRLTTTLSHTTSSFVLRSTVYVAQYTADAYMEAALLSDWSDIWDMVVTAYLQTHGTNTLLHTSWALTHTADATLRTAQLTVIHMTNSLLRQVYTATHTANSLLHVTVTPTHTTDAYTRVKPSFAPSHTADARLWLVATLGHTANAVLHIQGTQTQTTDSLIRVSTAASHTTGALLRRATATSHTTSSFLGRQTAVSHSTAALLRRGAPALRLPPIKAPAPVRLTIRRQPPARVTIKAAPDIAVKIVQQEIGITLRA